MRLSILLAALFALYGCSSTNKTRLDCYNDCKSKGFKWSGIISRSERVDDQGILDTREVCRCIIEEPL